MSVSPVPSSGTSPCPPCTRGRTGTIFPTPPYPSSAIVVGVGVGSIGRKRGVSTARGVGGHGGVSRIRVPFLC